MANKIQKLKNSTNDTIYPVTVKDAIYDNLGNPLSIADTASVVTVDAKVGDLSLLTTTNKTSAVNAINEVDSDVTSLVNTVNGINSNINAVDNKIGLLSALQTVDKTSVVGAINENNSAISSNFNLLSKFSFQAHKPYRAWQGVSTDGEFIYVVTDRDEDFNLQNIISVYDMKGNFVREKTNAYTGTDPQGKFMSFGDCTIIDGELFVTAYNINSGGSPLVSRVIRFSLSNLAVTSSHEVGGGVAECVIKKGSEYWISYHDVQHVKRFNSSFSLLNTYALSQPISSQGGYQGMFWIGEYLYLNMHGANNMGGVNVGSLDKYSFNGSAFTFLKSIKPPTFGATQGVSVYGDAVYWNDRPANEIVITNSIETSSMQPILNPITNNNIFKPTLLNDWIPFDATYDRTLKVWKDPFGVVHLEGIVKEGVIGSVICKLPEGYRPQYSRNFAIDSGSAYGRLAIIGNNSLTPAGGEGEVSCVVGSSTYVCLDGVTFLADPTI